MSDERIERGAAEEMSGAPLTETEAETATRPASQPESDEEVQQGTADTTRPARSDEPERP